MSRYLDPFQVLFDANPRPMWLTDMESLAFIHVNQATCRLYGWTREEFRDMTLRAVRYPEDLADLDRALAAHRDQVGTFKRATRHRTKAGRLLEVDLEITRFDLEGRRSALVVITEVTGIDDVERRFRLLVEHSTDGVMLVDESGIIRYVSPGGARMLGYDATELVGHAAREMLHPDDSTAARVGPGETREYLVRACHRDGTWRWLEATATNLIGDPAVHAIVNNFRDATARIHAEAELRRSEQNFRTLIERAPTVTLVHRNGVILYVNAAAIALLGYDNAAELIGRPVVDLVHPDDLASVSARMAKTIREGRGAPGEARMQRRDGTYIAMDGEGMLLDFDGAPASVVVGRDVTERREMFARMAVADRMLSVGTLAAGVAHEINNPLSYMLANLQVIARELADGGGRLSRQELQALVADAQDGASRVSAIVRDLRALARSDDESRTAVDLAEVLASSVKMAFNELRHRARLVQDVPAGLPPVTGNSSRLGQVFLNLLVNAAQAIDAGRANENEVRVRAYAAGTEVVVEIQDTGVGIPDSVIGRIFDPFFTTKPVGVGMGLGLAISHQIVRSFGGTLTVESTPGQGSIFRVALPAERDERAAVTSPQNAPKAAHARVLMIDDEPAVGRSIRVLLAPDYDITPVTRARDGLARLADGEKFDAIVCDLMMPEMSGIELYEQLAPEYRRRVVFVTGGAFTERAREFLSKNEQPHVEKPFTDDELRRAIEQVRTP